MVTEVVAGYQDLLATKWCAGKPPPDSEDGDESVAGGAVAGDLLGKRLVPGVVEVVATSCRIRGP